MIEGRRFPTIEVMAILAYRREPARQMVRALGSGAVFFMASNALLRDRGLLVTLLAAYEAMLGNKGHF